MQCNNTYNNSIIACISSSRGGGSAVIVYIALAISLFMFWVELIYAAFCLYGSVHLLRYELVLYGNSFSSTGTLRGAGVAERRAEGRHRGDDQSHGEVQEVLQGQR